MTVLKTILNVHKAPENDLALFATCLDTKGAFLAEDDNANT